jgi:Skp family chaperone for outer membrane proteins
MIRQSVSLRPIFLGLAAGLILAGPVAAQAPAGPAPAPADALVGPLVPGVCVLGREAVFANAKVGQAANARLLELSKQAQAEIEAERAPIEADIKALEAQKASLTPAQLDERGKPLAARWDGLQRKAGLRSREIEATRAKAFGRVATEAQPIIAQAYASRKCGVLFAREAMLGGNPGADLTAAVVQGLDARITTITFPRETLPVEGAAAAPKAR